MSPFPFSLNTKFLPTDGREDKIELQIGGWDVFDLGGDASDVLNFKQHLSSPPDGCEEMAWPEKGKGKSPSTPPSYGWFFLRPETQGKNQNKLLIRSRSLKHRTLDHHHEAPLCGGHCLFYREKKSLPVSCSSIHRVKLRLFLNLQRFIRHQPKGDDPASPKALTMGPRLKKRSEKRSSREEEFSLDGEDNWLPNTLGWKKYGAQDHLETYLELIQKQVDRDLKRACAFAEFPLWDEWDKVTAERGQEYYSLRKVETLWEFPSENPIGDVFDIGQKLLHLKRQESSAKFYKVNHKGASRNMNSPCITIPLAENVMLKLYAKTNRRVRFEVVQSELIKKRSDLLKEAGVPFHPEARPIKELSIMIKVLRQRAAGYMNGVMDELRAGRDHHTQARSLVNLLAEIAAAVPSQLSEKERNGQIQTLLLFLCYQRGFRGNVKTGPYAVALATLAKRHVLTFQRARQFYVLSPAYVLAADSLIAATGDPLLPIFGSDGSAYKLTADGKTFLRIRSEM